MTNAIISSHGSRKSRPIIATIMSKMRFNF
jgi:hypothetical protein